MPNELSYKDYPDGTKAYFRDDTAREQINGLNASKLTLVERKETSTGNTLTFDTPIQSDTMYLIAMTAPVTSTERYMKCSMIRAVGTTTNEISFGDSRFVVTVSDLKVTITDNRVLYGLRASLIKLE